MFSHTWIPAIALVATACTFEIKDGLDDGDHVCPAYYPAPCAPGTYSTTTQDEFGCDVLQCTACPDAAYPTCRSGEIVAYDHDEFGCSVPKCTPAPVPPACPAYDLVGCPPNSELVYRTDENGCRVPQCTMSNCPDVALPSCAPDEHLEYVVDGCSCPVPVCVADDGCDPTAKAAEPNDQGIAAPAPPYPCYQGCLAYAPEPCPEGQHEVTSYDAYGCPVTTCEDDGCVVGGCSGQLCGEAGSDLVSTCEWREDYACYQNHGTCERQSDGRCGWTPTEKLKLCLAESSGTY